MVFSIREPAAAAAKVCAAAGGKGSQNAYIAAATAILLLLWVSDVRHFRGAILGLLRPSEAWCFPAGR